MTVWATEQENMEKVAKWERLHAKVETSSLSKDAESSYGDGNKDSGHDYLVPWHLPLYRADAAAAAGASAASSIDQAKNALVFRRYYHLFTPGELEDLVNTLSGATVVDSFYDKDNWCVIFQKDA